MRWLARFLAWATVLSLPAWLVGETYHRALARLALAFLGLPDGSVAFRPPDIPASHVLGVYAALCLATTRAPRARRLSALAIGLACMVALEVATGTLAIRWSLDQAARGAPSAAAQRLRDHLTSLPAWIGAPSLWLALLGRWALPPPGGGRLTPARPAPGPGRGYS